MIDKKEMTVEELQQVLGGTIGESADLVLALCAHKYGLFVKHNPGREDLVDVEGLVDFFASKGYKFIPGYGEKTNLFIGPDGMRYCNDVIVEMINNKQF